eukprot:CAMPEP_0170150156 /NCGR_PEP_ID=MMETSP0033_2-20121228/45409_1 /TAXON_ID=195969 /ORGANISM="Dolichomastix tenuilepis, Strain CCMP3274" /LENGTH=59 /DNA_ID=CAMNT_0010387163 /DNA_START=66 /DNA_END=242 /DNA_ORIENTATION=+
MSACSSGFSPIRTPPRDGDGAVGEHSIRHGHLQLRRSKRWTTPLANSPPPLRSSILSLK